MIIIKNKCNTVLLINFCTQGAAKTCIKGTYYKDTVEVREGKEGGKYVLQYHTCSCQ